MPQWIGNSSHSRCCNNKVVRSLIVPTPLELVIYIDVWSDSFATCVLKRLFQKDKCGATRNRLKKTCHDTCGGLCDSGEKIEIDFDDMDAGVVGGVQYYCSDIQLDNWYAINGENYSDTGYVHGTISDPNVGLNGYGEAMSMTCPNGSFSLYSVWLTPAWTWLTALELTWKVMSKVMRLQATLPFWSILSFLPSLSRSYLCSMALTLWSLARPLIRLQWTIWWLTLRLLVFSIWRYLSL